MKKTRHVPVVGSQIFVPKMLKCGCHLHHLEVHPADHQWQEYSEVPIKGALEQQDWDSTHLSGAGCLQTPVGGASRNYKFTVSPLGQLRDLRQLTYYEKESQINWPQLFCCYKTTSCSISKFGRNPWFNRKVGKGN